MSRVATEERALSVGCPFCFAAAGKSCRMVLQSPVIRTHTSRFKLASGVLYKGGEQ